MSLLDQTRHQQKRRGQCQEDGADLEPNYGRASAGKAGQHGQSNQERCNYTVDPLADV